MLKERAGENGSRLEGDTVDVTDEAEVSGLVETIVVKHGRLDAMVNTVGGYAGEAKYAARRITKVFDLMLALNLTAMSGVMRWRWARGAGDAQSRAAGRILR